MVAGLLAGLVVSTTDGCYWDVPEELTTWVAYDVGRSAGADTLFALMGRDAIGTSGAQLFESDDAGAGWSAFGQALPPDFSPSSFIVSNDAREILVAGRDPGAQTVLTTRSTDAAASWSSLAAPSLETRGEVPRLVGDPFDVDRVYLRLDAIPLAQDAPDPPDRLLVSGDGGATWSLVVEASADLPGLAFSPDSSSIAIAGPSEGLLVGRRAEAVDAIGAALEQTFEDPVWGLAWTEGGLFGGHDDFGADGAGFSLGVSRDSGRTFGSVLGICDVTLARCPRDSTSEVACRDVYERLTGFEQSILLSQRCAGADVDSDAGLPAPRAEATDKGCACNSGRRSSGSVATVLSAASVTVFLRRRRRRAQTDATGPLPRWRSRGVCGSRPAAD